MTPTTTTPLGRLPYLTPDIAPIRAAIKRRYEDFRVEEIPAYEPCGEGTHTYFKIEKTGLATMRAAHDIARALGVASRDIGVAGLKDARGITVQTLSVEHCDPERIRALDIPRIRILDVSRHTNKLKIGHLHGNRFILRLRDVDADRLDDLRTACDTLAKRGVPNYFGQQRFGHRGDTWKLGHAVLKDDAKEVVDLMLGRPTEFDTGPVKHARQLYEQGKYGEAVKTWPYGFRDNRKLARQMERYAGKHNKAYRTIDSRMLKFFVNAYQSHLFNQVLARRINEIDAVQLGDLAYKHDSGSVFRVEDVQAENIRAAAGEISPTGPLYGGRMTRPDGVPCEIEDDVLHDEHVSVQDFDRLKRMKIHGSRRPLRFFPRDLAIENGTDEFGFHVELRFSLPSGCYATMLLREICKSELDEGLEDEE
ncbi:MAG: tRNA pseudouridine(13) synthase TruD [Phycisphaerales bacterium]|nr:tRNA pseudouridine(13) synthase TruD [Phycisphaerales bacterium]MCB9863615.1 tRNA pseudouridine(13) synthase TruD [Phycisphaerales bacterium]